MKLIRMLFLEGEPEDLARSLRRLIGKGVREICFKASADGGSLVWNQGRVGVKCRVLDTGEIRCTALGLIRIVQRMGGQSVLIGTSKILNGSTFARGDWRTIGNIRAWGLRAGECRQLAEAA